MLCFQIVAHLAVQFTYIIIEHHLTLLPVVLLEDGQCPLVVVDGQMCLVLHIIDIAQTAVDDGASIVDGLCVIATLRDHRVDDGQRVLIQTDGLVVLLTAIVHLCKMTYHVLPHVQAVLLIAQGQRLTAVVFSFFAVVGQPAAHQFVVGTQQVVALGRVVTLQRRFQGVNTGIAMVVVSQSRQAGKQAKRQIQMLHNSHKVTHFPPFSPPHGVEFRAVSCIFPLLGSRKQK